MRHRTARIPGFRHRPGHHTATAALLVLALTGGAFAAVGQAVADDTTTTADTATETVEERDLGPAEADDEATARLLAQAQDRRIEILSARTETGSTYANPDGTLTAEAFAAQVRVKEDGRWKELDTSLSDTGTALTPDTAAADITVSDGGDTALASVSEDGRTFGLGWAEKLPSPTVDGDTASYDLGAGETLEVTALPQGFSQNVLLDRAPDEPVSYRIPLELDGLTLAEADSGHLLLTDPSGALIAEAPAPMMWDSSRNELSGEPERQARVDADIETAADGSQTLVLTPDAGFLAEATYPVTVDPTSTLAVTTDTWVATNYTDSQVSSTELKSGTYDAGGTKARSYLKFDVSDFADKHITDTNLSLYSYWSSSCSTAGAGTQIRRITSTWSSSTVTWDEQPSTTTTGAVTSTAAKGYSDDCPAGTVNFDIDDIVQDWADGSTNYGIQVRGASETDSLTWRRYRSANYIASDSAVEPHLTVTYNSYPSTATQILPPASAVTPDATPTLWARASDADADQLRYTFEVWDSGLTTRKTTGNSKYLLSGRMGTWTAGTLAAGTYKWRVKAYDATDLSKSWSAWRTLTVDPTAPAAPGITSTSHASSTGWYAADDFTGTLTADDTSGIDGYAVKIDRSPATGAGTTVTQTSTTVSAADRADGTWYVHAAARNKAGLWSTTQSLPFNVDTTAPSAPTVTSSTHPLGTSTYASRTASFTWTAPTDTSGVAAYAVSVDQNASTLPSSSSTTQTAASLTTTVSADGTWYLHVRAKDKAGNWAASAAHYSFGVDSTLALLPTVSSATHPDQAAAYKTTAFTATWATSAAAAGYSYVLDAASDTVPNTTTDSTTASYAGTVTEGTWYLHVRAADAAGTWGPTAHYRFTVDTTAPAVPTVSSPDFPDEVWAGDAGDTGTFTLSSGDKGLKSFTYALDGGTATTVTATAAAEAIDLTPASDGSHKLTVTATDKAGNTSAATAYTFHVGGAGLTAPLAGEEAGHSVTLTAAGPADLTGATFQYRRGDSDAWADIPVSAVSLASDASAVTWPVAMTDGITPDLTWDTDALADDGELQLRAVFTGANSPAPSDAVEVLLKRVDVTEEGTDLDSMTEPTTVQSYALEAAEERAEVSADTLAPPYLDQDTGDIVAPVAEIDAKDDATAAISLTDVPVDLGTGDGSTEDTAEAADGTTTTEDDVAGTVATTDATVTPVTEVVAHSQAELDSVADEILYLDEDDITGATALASARVDAETNKVVVEIAAEDDGLADRLGQRYGNDMITVRVNPGVTEINETADRWSDKNPFKGGAGYESHWPAGEAANKFAACTTGFAWTYKGNPYIVTAGHCTTLDGWMNTWDKTPPDNSMSVGSVDYDNYTNGKGSAKLSGQSYYSGDLSLIRIYENKYNVSARIYKKGSTLRRVENRWTTRSKKAEQFCTGGARSSEVCGWKVTETKKRWKYGNGDVAQNMTVAEKNSGACIIGGDSGGPVYTVKSNGYVYAKGIISGSGCVSLTDDGECSDSWDGKCRVFFTDISLAEKALPGGVKKW
ncbi:DNRLRE domain-containing protein [Streptomyces europaeiscabiei]|uniref:DNRLRE domain-containing protein n=1 Tax=Streptomyces europaeiscabiei TaxID=146819 RepID=UPI0029A74298|nr:DNRLRE domain-containing protein [Streptomyces europaeiscabiei]MDX3615694.1 DNRLRE domain-containing protein [Streptomyces europaeiscabiei]MDX3636435.1 DNRLRE domain-containing protein [Streptomyces europaeiscabiei]MDX3654470.1 DNRLRE domain-containing protein [Streptomyces europaeiscabiei]